MDMRSLEAFVFERMSASNLPGLSIALVREGELVYARGFGQRDLANGLPATPNTLYSIGSVTKSFTALAILQLAERGLLEPGDPVDRFLPFPIRPRGEQVRIEHLLSHTSGIPALAYSEALIGHANGTGGRWLPISGPEDVLTFMDGAERWVEDRPGERWAYANEGYALLGLLIEQVSGRPYEEYLREEILAPLGMDRSHLDRKRVEADRDVAVPYVIPPDGPARPGRYLYRRIRSEGGLISSVLDLARYLAMFQAGGSNLVSPQTLAEMLRPRVALPARQAAYLPPGEREDGDARHYGYGLSLESLLGRRLVGHGGSVLVSTAHMAFLPDDGWGVAVLANGSGYPLAHVARAALTLALTGDTKRLPVIRLHDRLDGLTGRYRTYRGTVTARVVRHGDFLKLFFGSGSFAQEIILVPEAVDDELSLFSTLSEGQRLPVRFRSGGYDAAERGEFGVELLYERYKLRREGML